VIGVAISALPLALRVGSIVAATVKSARACEDVNLCD